MALENWLQKLEVHGCNGEVGLFDDLAIKGGWSFALLLPEDHAKAFKVVEDELHDG